MKIEPHNEDDGRIAVFMDTVVVSGPARQLVSASNVLRRQGFSFHFITTSRNGSRNPFADYLADHGLPVLTVAERFPLDPRVPWAVLSFLKAHGIGRIQTHGYKGSVMGALAKRILGAKWIGFFHGATAENRKVQLYHALDRVLLKGADEVVVMSAAQSTELGIPTSMVLANAVLDHVRHRSSHAVAPRADQARLFVASRLSPEKGIDVLLAALATLEVDVPVHCTIAGEGPDREALERQARELGLGRMVHFVGHLTDLSSHFSTADVVVIPSRSEGLPNVLLEAVHCGIPVVATSVGGIPDLFAVGAVGELVPAENPTALAAAITRQLRRGPDAEYQAARQSVMRDYSLDARTTKLAALYRRVGITPRVAAP